MNECHFMGNLTRDPETRAVNETSVTNFTVAISRKFKKSNGETVKETAFIDCEAWDTGGETIAKYFKKGDPIIVHCSAKTDNWTDKDGKNRSKTKFRVNKFDFLLSKPTARVEVETDEDPDIENDEIPF